LATTFNENEQQQGANNNAELWTKWMKTPWKTFEETDEAETGLSKPKSRRMMMMMINEYGIM